MRNVTAREFREAASALRTASYRYEADQPLFLLLNAHAELMEAAAEQREELDRANRLIAKTGEAFVLLKQAEAQRDALRDALMEAVQQACYDKDGEVDSMALSAYADALRLLATAGFFTITHEVGRRVIGRWTKPL